MSRSVPGTPREQGVNADVPPDRTSVDDAAPLSRTASPDPTAALAEHPTLDGASGVGARTRDHLRVAVPVALSLSLVMLSLASVLAIRSSSAADEATSQQELQLSAAARQAATAVSREIDVVRLSTLLAARTDTLARVAAAEGNAPKAELAAARLPLETLAELRPGLVSIARLRGATGREIVRVVDEQTGRTGVSETANLSSGATGSPWVAQAARARARRRAHHRRARQQRPARRRRQHRGHRRLRATVPSVSWRSTPRSRGCSRRPRRVAGGAEVDLTSADQMVGGTSTATGIDASTSAYGVTHAGDDAVAWARTSYDAGLPGPVYLDWVVTMTTPTVASGLAAQAPLTIALFVLGLALLVAGLVGCRGVEPARGSRAARRSGVERAAAGAAGRHVGRALPRRVGRPGRRAAGGGVRGRRPARDGGVVRLDHRTPARPGRARRRSTASPWPRPASSCARAPRSRRPPPPSRAAWSPRRPRRSRSSPPRRRRSRRPPSRSRVPRRRRCGSPRRAGSRSRRRSTRWTPSVRASTRSASAR